MNVYKYFDERLKKYDDDYEISEIIMQLTKRENRILDKILKEIGKSNEPLKYSAFDTFITLVLNSHKLPQFSLEYKSELMWNQETRLKELKDIFNTIAIRYLPNSKISKQKNGCSK